jgi:hypothetical protein
MVRLDRERPVADHHRVARAQEPHQPLVSLIEARHFRAARVARFHERHQPVARNDEVDVHIRVLMGHAPVSAVDRLEGLRQAHACTVHPGVCNGPGRTRTYGQRIMSLSSLQAAASSCNRKSLLSRGKAKPACGQIASSARFAQFNACRVLAGQLPQWKRTDSPATESQAEGKDEVNGAGRRRCASPLSQPDSVRTRRAKCRRG